MYGTAHELLLLVTVLSLYEHFYLLQCALFFFHNQAVWGESNSIRERL